MKYLGKRICLAPIVGARHVAPPAILETPPAAAASITPAFCLAQTNTAGVNGGVSMTTTAAVSEANTQPRNTNLGHSVSVFQ